MNQNAYAAYISIDWSDRKHDIYLYDCTTGAAEESVIGSQPDAIQAWVEDYEGGMGTLHWLCVWSRNAGPSFMPYVSTKTLSFIR